MNRFWQWVFIVSSSTHQSDLAWNTLWPLTSQIRLAWVGRTLCSFSEWGHLQLYSRLYRVMLGLFVYVFRWESKGRQPWLARVVLPMKGNLDMRRGRSIAIGSFPFRPGDETRPNSHRLRKRLNNRDSRDSLPLPAAFQRFPAAGIWSQPRNLALALRFDEPCSWRFLRLWLIYKQTENNLSERWRRTEGEGGRERVMEKERERLRLDHRMSCFD